MTPTPPAEPAASDFPPTATRPVSLWPETTRPAELGSTQSSFAPSRFDPIAEERARLQTQAAAAFDVCHPALALRAVLLVQLVLAGVALAGADSLPDWGARQAVLAFGGVAGTLLWLVVVCALRPLLQRAEAAWRAAAVLGLGALCGLLAWAPLGWAGLADSAGGLRIAAVMVGGLAFAALLWAWLDLRSRIWHPATASARLAELQSRIRPHFLFNALNTALALVRVDPARAETVLEDLAQLFRVALAEPGAAVSVHDEIELARRYLAIEQVRFGPRLSVQWDIDPRVNSARLPPLVLQPLVENAVRHGIETAPRGGKLNVRAQVQRGQVVLQVSNTVGDEPASPGHGMALLLARARLRLLIQDMPELGATVVAEAADADEAAAALQAHAVDAVLLDIRLPGRDGLRVAAQIRALPRAPAVIFVTAYAEHALQAFELEALDYLTKPVRAERLRAALVRVRQRLRLGSEPAIDGAVLVFSERGRTLRLPLAEVLVLKAEQKYVTLRTVSHNHVLDDALSDLEQRLAELGGDFIRIHRNALVARRAIRALELRGEDEGGEGWAVRVAPLDEWLAVSRRQVSAVRAALAPPTPSG